MENQTEKNNLKEKIINKIKNDEIKMHSKSYFAWKNLSLILIAVFSFVFSVFLASFIVFFLSSKSFLPLLGFGARGFFLFSLSLPWPLIVSLFFLIIIIEIIFKKSQLVYRRPIIYSVLCVVFFILLTGFIIGKGPTHQQLLNRSYQHKLPLIGPLYRGEMMAKLHGANIGKVVELKNNILEIETAQDNRLIVVLSEKTRFPFHDVINEGDTIMIVGPRRGDNIQAIAIRKLGKKKGSKRHFRK